MTSTNTDNIERMSANFEDLSISTTTSTELREYHATVDKYSGLRHDGGKVKADMLVEHFFATHETKYHTIRKDYDDVYSVVSQAYMFSDHKNKYFEQQYEYLLRTHPTINERLPKDILIELIAIASNTSFYWYSD